MQINAPSIVAGVLALAQGALAVMVIAAAVGALRALRSARSADERDFAETERLRPVVPAVGVLIVAAASWPLLIGVLDSYVGEWPGTICIQGITRIGERSVGAARYLPVLLDVLLVTKPLLLLAAAAWVVTHAVTRRVPGRPGALGPALLLGLGTFAAIDALAELTYLAIPKQDDILATGCCVGVPAAYRSAGSSWLEQVLPSLGNETAVTLLIGAGCLLIALLLPPACRGATGRPLSGAAWTAILGIAAALGVLAQHVVIAVVSPAVHGVASHRCGWCVLERTTFGGPAIGALAVGLGLTALAALAASLERRAPDAAPYTSRGLARVAVVGLVVAGVLAALDAV